jgi:hypothetical protein
MVNIYNKRLTVKRVPEPGLMGGILPVAPVNRLAMLTDYVEPGNVTWHARTRTWYTTAGSHSTRVRWCSRCRPSASVSECLRLSTSAPTLPEAKP